MTLGLAMLVGGLIVSFLIIADEHLANRTQWRAAGLSCVYLVVLLVLYPNCSNIAACKPVYIMWENLGDWLGRDVVNFIWQVSMFTDFTIITSGTQSHLWKRFGYVIFGIFVFALFLRIMPH